MEVFTTIADLQYFFGLNPSKSIGLVPTMGALHEGHIALIASALSSNDIVVCSIFINPTQFNNPEDLKKYPRSLESDLKMLESAGCHVVFAPSDTQMYTTLPRTSLSFGAIESIMEGESRPGHFNGVGLVVSKLFNISRPQRAYFGQKDLQQVSVIRQLITDFSYPIELVVCPTQRQADGLAMSSRNRRLTQEETLMAPLVYKKLVEAKEALIAGSSVHSAKMNFEDFFKDKPQFQLDYFEIANSENLESIDAISPGHPTAICVAIFLGEVRLIDNLVF